MAGQVWNLWEDYLFLTKEMSKFLTKKEFELFFELMEQRERLQAMIDQAADQEFKQSQEGKGVLAAIRQENNFITTHLRMAMNQLQQQHNASQAYEGGAPPAGRRFDFQG